MFNNRWELIKGVESVHSVTLETVRMMVKRVWMSCAASGWCVTGLQSSGEPCTSCPVLLWTSTDTSLNQSSRDDLSHLVSVDKWWCCHRLKCALKLLEAPCCPTGGSSRTGCVNDAKLLFCGSADLRVWWFHGCKGINQTQARALEHHWVGIRDGRLPHNLLQLCF